MESHGSNGKNAKMYEEYDGILRVPKKTSDGWFGEGFAEGNLNVI